MNPSKKNAVSVALEEVGVKSFEIECFNVDSGVSSKPVGMEIIQGIDNRNYDLYKKASSEHLDYDYICSIEGGFELDQSNQHFVITYCGIVDREGTVYYGKSSGFPISKDMFEYVKSGNSLNKVIEEINGSENNKQGLGITGFLSDGLIIREKFDAQAVLSAIMQIVFDDNYQDIDDNILLKLEKKKESNYYE